jgi:hypothetical protein
LNHEEHEEGQGCEGGIDRLVDTLSALGFFVVSSAGVARHSIVRTPAPLAHDRALRSFGYFVFFVGQAFLLLAVTAFPFFGAQAFPPEGEH